VREGEGMAEGGAVEGPVDEVGPPVGGEWEWLAKGLLELMHTHRHTRLPRQARNLLLFFECIQESELC